MSEQLQDIDSRSGKVINKGDAVKHVDVEDGASIGHAAEPEGTDLPKPKELPAAPPQRVTRDEIYAKARKARTDEISDAVDGMNDEQRKNYDRMIAEAGGDVVDPFSIDDTAAPGPAKPAPKTVTAAKDVDVGEETVTITVYGMQEQVPRSEIEAAGGVTAYQKNRAADEKLRRLTTFEASLRDYDRQLTERAARVERGQPPAQAGTGSQDPPPTGDPAQAADEKELARKIAAGFFSGDEEQATTMLANALASVKTDAIRAVQSNGSRQPVVTAGQDTASDAAELVARQEANAVFRDEFGDLQTPVLRRAVLDSVREVAAEPLMRGRPLAEITREAGMRVRNDVFPGNPKGTGAAVLATPSKPIRQQTKSDSPGLNERLRLKSRTVITPMHETGRRFTAPAETEQEYPSNADYVQLLRKKRGQPTQ